jgi:hypothetical protein
MIAFDKYTSWVGVCECDGEICAVEFYPSQEHKGYYYYAWTVGCSEVNFTKRAINCNSMQETLEMIMDETGLSFESFSWREVKPGELVMLSKEVEQEEHSTPVD